MVMIKGNIGEWKNPLGLHLNAEPEGPQGFIYIIQCGWCLYLGRKESHSVKMLPPLKGYKRRRRKVKATDYLKYTGSSNALNEMIADGAPYKKSIIMVCHGKAELQYSEMCLQFLASVLTDDRFLNKEIRGRCGRLPIATSGSLIARIQDAARVIDGM